MGWAANGLCGKKCSKYFLNPLLIPQGIRAALQMYTKKYLKNMRRRESSSKEFNFLSPIGKRSSKVSTLSPSTIRLSFKPSTFSPHKDKPCSKLSDSFTLTGTILTSVQSMTDFSAIKDKQSVIKASQILLVQKVERKISSSKRSLVSSILKNVPCQTSKYRVSL